MRDIHIFKNCNEPAAGIETRLFYKLCLTRCGRFNFLTGLYVAITEDMDMMKKGTKRSATTAKEARGAVETVKPIRKTSRTRATARKTADEVRIDYPQDAEIVISPHYTYRVSVAPDAAKVEVSVNGGDWRSCRESLGFWWFDWHGYKPGSHVVTARAEKKSGKFAISTPRHFSVKL